MSSSNTDICDHCGFHSNPIYKFGDRQYCGMCYPKSESIPPEMAKIAGDPPEITEIKRALDCLADCIEETRRTFELHAMQSCLSPFSAAMITGVRFNWEHKPEFNFGTRKKVGDD